MSCSTQGNQGMGFNFHCKAHVTNRSGVTVKCEPGIVDFYIVLCDCIVATSLSMSSAVCKLYIGHRSVVLICAIQQLSALAASDLCTLLLLIVHVRTVCVKVEQKNTKLNNQMWLVVRQIGAIYETIAHLMIKA